MPGSTIGRRGKERLKGRSVPAGSRTLEFVSTLQNQENQF